MFDPHLAQADPEVATLVAAEEQREFEKIRLIPSENYASRAVLEATGSVFTNKYSEGYAGKRYYEGQQCVDPLEQLAIARAKALFGADHANVQPYSGSPGEPGRLLRAAQAGRHRHGDGAAARRPPDARLERVDHRHVLPQRAVRRAASRPG